jgi:hypothetical protein
MSLSPSFPQGAPTLAEILLQRAFARPAQPFADGPVLEALARADDAKQHAEPPEVAPVPSDAATYSHGDSGSASGDDAPSASESATGVPGRTIDVRV